MRVCLTCLTGWQGIRTVDIVAVSDVRTLTIPREAFHWLIQGTDVLERMRHLSEMRRNEAWGVINSNSVLRQLTSSQKTQLEEYVHRRVYLEGEYIWRAHEPTLAAVLVDDGSVRFDRAVRPRNTKLSEARVTGQRASKAPAPVELGPGSFVCDIDNLLSEG